MRKKQPIKYCEWCGKKTKNDPKPYFEIPIMEWVEEKINDFDRMEMEDPTLNHPNSDESELDDPNLIELHVYNFLLNTQKDKIICDDCFNHDNVLCNEYYEEADIKLNERGGEVGFYIIY
jgi:hypothetical protein